MAVGGSPARQADLALGHGKARDRVHQAKHVLVLVAEIFRNGEREKRGLAAHQCRLIGGRHHHDRALETLLAEVILQKLLHLAATFADKADHRNVGVHVAGKHRQQHRFADAGAGEDAEPLRGSR